MNIRETKIRYRNAFSDVLIEGGAKIVKIVKGADITDRKQEKFQERVLKQMAIRAHDDVAAGQKPADKARITKALKKVNGDVVVNGTRFIDPASEMTYAAGSKEGRGKWLCTGVKNTRLVHTFTERVILKNRTPFQPKRAR